MANRVKMTAKRKKLFIEELSNHGNITLAAAAVGISRNLVYEHKQKDKTFAERLEIALERGIDALIDECRRRAHQGYEEPVYHGGDLVGHKLRFSDSLAMFLIKARRPEYRDKLGVDMPPGSEFSLNINIGEKDNGETG